MPRTPCISLCMPGTPCASVCMPGTPCISVCMPGTPCVRWSERGSRWDDPNIAEVLARVRREGRTVAGAKHTPLSWPCLLLPGLGCGWRCGVCTEGRARAECGGRGKRSSICIFMNHLTYLHLPPPPPPVSCVITLYVQGSPRWNIHPRTFLVELEYTQYLPRLVYTHPVHSQTPVHTDTSAPSTISTSSSFSDYFTDT